MMQKNNHHDAESPEPENGTDQPTGTRATSIFTEDWLAIVIGGVILLVILALNWLEPLIAQRSEPSASMAYPLKQWVTKPGSWSDNPMRALVPERRPVALGPAQFILEGLGAQAHATLAGPVVPTSQFLVPAKGAQSVKPKPPIIYGMITAFLVGLLAFAIGSRLLGQSAGKFAGAFCVVFLLALAAFILAGQEVVKHYNLEYALWALFLGLIISNTIGMPEFVRPAVRTEFYIKTGLVLLGAEILLGRLLTLGVPGIFVAWVVTPIVLVGTYWFGQRILKIQSRSLNMVISADMSVCGVSAAIATAAACKAKREELSLAIGMSLTFTVIMMVLMPAVIRAVGMSDILGGAWMGGTIDSTGAVAAAGGILGKQALEVAATVKMIQNILIGVIAFAVAIYWVAYVERGESGVKPKASEIWVRFPKFVLGFVAASIVFSYIHASVDGGPALVSSTLDCSKTLRGWFFCLAFISIGLETNFRQLAGQLHGGKPLLLYLVGQTFNLCFTLFMAWLMFEVLFADQVSTLFKK